MKYIDSLKKCSIILLLLIAVSPLANAQARYKHVPRVKVEKVRTVETPVTTHSNEVIIPIQQEVTPVVENNSIEPTEVATVTKNEVTLSVEKSKNSNKLPIVQ